MTDPTPPPRARDALARIFGPLARVMIARGLRLSDGVALMKAALVAAARDSAGAATPMTDSRLSLMTGVHRKDLRALREEGATPRPPRSLAATLIGRWMADPAWLDAEGRPRPLPRRAGDGPSFESLAASVSTDIHPRSVLEELLRTGAVEETQEDPPRIALRAEALTPAADSDAALDFLARNLADHAAAAAHNITAPEGAPRHLERAVFYNRLSPDSVARLEAQAREGALALLRHLNAEALRAQREDAGRAGATHRFRFGAYFYTEDEGAPVADGGGSGDNGERER